jgi:hypothetical protein
MRFPGRLMIPILMLCGLAACTRKGPITVTREDTQTFSLPAGRSIEWKLRMSEGGQVEYSWTADQPVQFDFHSDHDDGTENFVSHKKDTLAADGGAFTAPFYGRHGWYWRNRSLDTVAVTLKTKGAYEVIGRTGGNAP